MQVFQKVLSFSLLLLLLGGLIPHTAWGYSYGNPNEEAVAEVYKKVAAALSQNPPDFSTATKEFQTIHNELDMHMGKEPGQVIEEALNNQDKALVIDAFQKTLVLNIARRLENIEKDFENYTQNKTLLAKGLATYDALSPVVSAKDAALDQKMRKDFEEALQALGNPGLFGVGVKKPDLNLYKEKETDIFESLKTFFQMESLEVGHFSAGAGPDNPQNPQNQSFKGMENLKNWLPLIVIILVLAFIVFRSMRKRRNG